MPSSSAITWTLPITSPLYSFPVTSPRKAAGIRNEGPVIEFIGKRLWMTEAPTAGKNFDGGQEILTALSYDDHYLSQSAGTAQLSVRLKRLYVVIVVTQQQKR